MKAAQLLLTLFDPMDYIAHEILQARILEWIAFPFLPNPGIESIWSPIEFSPGLLRCRQILYQLSHRGSPRILEWVVYSFSSGSSDPGIELESSALQADSLPIELLGKP